MRPPTNIVGHSLPQNLTEAIGPSRQAAQATKLIFIFPIYELFPEVPPRVEYELTGLGKSLLAPTEALLDWVEHNWPDIKKARGKFDEKRAE